MFKLREVLVQARTLGLIQAAPVCGSTSELGRSIKSRSLERYGRHSPKRQRASLEGALHCRVGEQERPQPSSPNISTHGHQSFGLFLTQALSLCFSQLLWL